ncbi:serine/threonine protein kinase [Bacillus sp. B-jedd]|uniref:serine/threonine protein kinase n=1 Tax=Bacillus sp. B-jedd TaxID=1476857 RepID=UPI0005157153|nr:protein kinase [Bacillus sp. B-jedd]CEG28760.1 protein kinase [Bacillus sp. B-jedd]
MSIYGKEERTVSIFRAIRKVYQFFADRPFKKGTVLNGHYEILRVIGAGSYGIVYQCQDLIANEIRVVKQLRPSKRRSKKEVALFRNEISVLRTLDHKNIPKLVETISTDGHLFYVMDFLKGDNLEEQIFLGKKTFIEVESLLVLGHLLELLEYLHKQHIYHQDLRIPNILISNKELFLIDFGLAKSSSHDRQENILEMKQQDYYDLGEILLYLLYTTYPSKSKKALPWTEELSLEKETVYLLKRLLQLEEPYITTSEISKDLHAALQANKRREED